jgi:hypothetical protein
MSEEHDKAMADFFARGGVIQQVAFRESGRIAGAPLTNSWGAKKAGRPSAKDKTEVPPEEDDE